MVVQTRNTRYILTDVGDGAFYIEGNQKYCAKPTLCTLLQPMQIGMQMVFLPKTGKYAGRAVCTTKVQEIIQ